MLSINKITGTRRLHDFAKPLIMICFIRLQLLWLELYQLPAGQGPI